MKKKRNIIFYNRLLPVQLTRTTAPKRLPYPLTARTAIAARFSGHFSFIIKAILWISGKAIASDMTALTRAEATRYLALTKLYCLC